MEKSLYGGNSVKLGKTYKAIGTIYIIMERNEGAREYLKRAYKIFEAKGMQRFMTEIKAKLKSISVKKTTEPSKNKATTRPKGKK